MARPGRRLCLLMALWLTGCQPAAQVTTLVNGERLRFAKAEAGPAVADRTGWQAWDLAADLNGGLYVADTQHHRILQIDALGTISVAAGDDEAADRDGPAAEARFKEPHGLALGRYGLLIADSGNRKIKRLYQGKVSNELVSAPLLRPVAVAEDSQNRLLVADAGAGTIWRKLPQRAPEPLLRLEAHRLLQDLFLGPGDAIYYSDNFGLWELKDGRRRLELAAGASFSRLTGMIFWAGGQLLSDAYGQRLLRHDAAGPVPQAVTIPKGDPALRFPGAISAAPDGTIYLAEPDAGRIRRLRQSDTGLTAEIFARSGTQGFGVHRDGEDLSMPHALLYDRHRNHLLVGDYFNQRLLQIDAQGAAMPWLEKSGLNLPAGLAQDASGRLYIAAQHKIYVVETDGKLRVLAGDGSPGLRDGAAAQARFWLPRGLDVAPDGSLLVADHGNHAIRKISPTGQVSTLAGNGEPGFANGLGAEARFHHPADVLRLPDGKLLIADSWNHQIRQLDATGRVSSYAGGNGPGLRDVWRGKAQFYHPSAIARGPAGDLYVADSFNHRIRRILPSGEVRTLAGSGYLLNWNGGDYDGDGPNAQFNAPMDLSLDPQGRLLVADTGNHRIRVITGISQ